MDTTTAVITAAEITEGDIIKFATGASYTWRTAIAAHPHGTDRYPEVIIWADFGRNKPEAVRVSADLTVEVRR